MEHLLTLHSFLSDEHSLDNFTWGKKSSTIAVAKKSICIKEDSLRFKLSSLAE